MSAEIPRVPEYLTNKKSEELGQFHDDLRHVKSDLESGNITAEQQREQAGQRRAEFEEENTDKYILLSLKRLSGTESNIISQEEYQLLRTVSNADFFTSYSEEEQQKIGQKLESLIKKTSQRLSSFEEELKDIYEIEGEEGVKNELGASRINPSSLSDEVYWMKQKKSLAEKLLYNLNNSGEEDDDAVDDEADEGEKKYNERILSEQEVESLSSIYDEFLEKIRSIDLGSGGHEKSKSYFPLRESDSGNYEVFFSTLIDSLNLNIDDFERENGRYSYLYSEIKRAFFQKNLLPSRRKSILSSIKNTLAAENFLLDSIESDNLDKNERKKLQNEVSRLQLFVLMPLIDLFDNISISASNVNPPEENDSDDVWDRIRSESEENKAIYENAKNAERNGIHEGLKTIDFLTGKKKGSLTQFEVLSEDVRQEMEQIPFLGEFSDLYETMLRKIAFNRRLISSDDLFSLRKIRSKINKKAAFSPAIIEYLESADRHINSWGKGVDSQQASEEENAQVLTPSYYYESVFLKGAIKTDGKSSDRIYQRRMNTMFFEGATEILNNLGLDDQNFFTEVEKLMESYRFAIEDPYTATDKGLLYTAGNQTYHQVYLAAIQEPLMEGMTKDRSKTEAYSELLAHILGDDWSYANWDFKNQKPMNMSFDKEKNHKSTLDGMSPWTRIITKTLDDLTSDLVTKADPANAESKSKIMKYFGEEVRAGNIKNCPKDFEEVVVLYLEGIMSAAIDAGVIATNISQAERHVAPAVRSEGSSVDKLSDGQIYYYISQQKTDKRAESLAVRIRPADQTVPRYVSVPPEVVFKGADNQSYIDLSSFQDYQKVSRDGKDFIVIRRTAPDEVVSADKKEDGETERFTDLEIEIQKVSRPVQEIDWEKSRSRGTRILKKRQLTEVEAIKTVEYGQRGANETTDVAVSRRIRKEVEAFLVYRMSPLYAVDNFGNRSIRPDSNWSRPGVREIIMQPEVLAKKTANTARDAVEAFLKAEDDFHTPIQSVPENTKLLDSIETHSTANSLVGAWSGPSEGLYGMEVDDVIRAQDAWVKAWAPWQEELNSLTIGKVKKIFAAASYNGVASALYAQNSLELGYEDYEDDIYRPLKASIREYIISKHGKGRRAGAAKTILDYLDGGFMVNPETSEFVIENLQSPDADEGGYDSPHYTVKVEPPNWKPLPAYENSIYNLRGYEKRKFAPVSTVNNIKTTFLGDATVFGERLKEKCTYDDMLNFGFMKALLPIMSEDLDYFSAEEYGRIVGNVRKNPLAKAGEFDDVKKTK